MRNSYILILTLFTLILSSCGAEVATTEMQFEQSKKVLADQEKAIQDCFDSQSDFMEHCYTVSDYGAPVAQEEIDKAMAEFDAIFDAQMDRIDSLNSVWKTENNVTN